MTRLSPDTPASRLSSLAAIAAFMVLLAPAITLNAAVAVSIDGARRFQAIDGFGVSANSASWNDGELRPAIDMLVDQMGATIWRVVLENFDGEPNNDDGDPSVMNWKYYDALYSSPKFEKLWATIAYLNRKGITSDLMLNMMGRLPGWMGGSMLNTASEDEWVEMIASTMYYGRVKRGLQIGMLAPLNETDWDGIEGPKIDRQQYVRILRKLSDRLDKLGMSAVRLVGPDTAQIAQGVSRYIPEMMGDPVLMSKVDHFALHDYSGETGGADAAIRASAFPARNFWMSEVTRLTDMFAMLLEGPAAILMWDGYDSVYNHAIVAGRGTTPPNDAGNGPAPLSYNAGTRTYAPRKEFYEYAQLFRFVPRGSRRVDATPSAGALAVLAFHQPATNIVTIVGRNTTSASQVLEVTLKNLPAVTTFRLYQTTESANLQQGSDVAVKGTSFTATVAPESVFTLTTANR